MWKDPLRALLAEKLKASTDKALQAQGEVNSEDLAALGRLTKLLDLRDQAQRQPRRWILAGAFALTLLVLGLLLFPLKEAEIELDLAATGIQFTLPTEQVLTHSIELSSLGAVGVRTARLPRDMKHLQPGSISFAGQTEAYQFSVPSGQKRVGTITLGTLVLPAGARVRLGCGELPGEYRLFVPAPDLTVSASLHGPLDIARQGTGRHAVDFAVPKSVELIAGSGDFELVFAPRTPKPTLFASQLRVENLSFGEIDVIPTQEDTTLVRRLSNIRSGRLYQESLNGKERVLRSGENLQFSASQGEMRSLELREDHLELRFYGRVRGMRIGPSERQRSLMPSRLQWLAAQPTLYLFWGALVYVLGLAVGVLRWWRVL